MKQRDGNTKATDKSNSWLFCVSVGVFVLSQPTLND